MYLYLNLSVQIDVTVQVVDNPHTKESRPVIQRQFKFAILHHESVLDLKNLLEAKTGIITERFSLALEGKRNI